MLKHGTIIVPWLKRKPTGGPRFEFITWNDYMSLCACTEERHYDVNNSRIICFLIVFEVDWTTFLLTFVF